MMASLFMVMRHLGMDHPPFPSVDPIVPPLLNHATLVMMVSVLQEHIPETPMTMTTTTRKRRRIRRVVRNRFVGFILYFDTL